MPFAEKRQSDRMPFTTRLTVLDAVTSQACEGNSIDLSVTGIQLYAARFFVAGTRLRIQFWLRDLPTTAPVELGAVVRWARVEQGGAIVGVEFDAPLSPSYCPQLYEELFAKR